MGDRLRVCDAAAAVLRETDNPAVMVGDDGLIQKIAERAGVTGLHPIQIEYNVLNALTRQSGVLIARKTASPLRHGRRSVRIFWLPEHAPKGDGR